MNCVYAFNSKSIAHSNKRVIGLDSLYFVKVVRNVDIIYLFCHIYFFLISILNPLFPTNAKIKFGMLNYLFVDKFMF